MSLDYINSNKSSNPFRPNLNAIPTNIAYLSEAADFAESRITDNEAYNDPTIYSRFIYTKQLPNTEFQPSWGYEGLRPDYCNGEGLLTPAELSNYRAKWKEGVPRAQKVLYSPRSAGSNDTPTVNMRTPSICEEDEQGEEREDDGSQSGDSCSEEFNEHDSAIPFYKQSNFSQDHYTPCTNDYTSSTSGAHIGGVANFSLETEIHPKTSYGLPIEQNGVS